jgi:hypothetical protein
LDDVQNVLNHALVFQYLVYDHQLENVVVGYEHDEYHENENELRESG